MTDQIKPDLIGPDHARAIPWPSRDDHKHSRGRLAVLAGGPLQTGAARLAARAGQRMGAGWVSLFGTGEACAVMAHHETAILIELRDDRLALSQQLADFDAVLIGPAFGLSSDCCADVLELVQHYHSGLVLDADALTHIGNLGEVGFEALRGRLAPAVLTPHSGEFARLFGAFDQDGKIVATQSAAKQSGSIVVHKGATTILAAPDGRVFVCDHATPFLATAGTGDVLAGMIGGLLAQGMATTDACAAAIWIHGETGRCIGAGLVAEDLIEMLPKILDGLAPAALKRSRDSDLA